MDKKILMIGVATAQNTTNVIPALQLDIDYYLSIETSAANQRGWAIGMTNVLKRKGVKVLDSLVLNENEDSRIDLISQRLKSIVTDDVEVLWNLGGGQKAQQFALWKTFMERVRQNLDEIACYANPETKKLEMWEYEGGELVYSAVDLDSKLDAKDIFEIYGYETKVDNDSLIYFDGRLSEKSLGLDDLMMHQEFREFFFGIPETDINNEKNQQVLSKKELSQRIMARVDFYDESLKDIVISRVNDNTNMSISSVLSFVPQFRKMMSRFLLDEYNVNRPVKKLSIGPDLKNLIFSITKIVSEELEISSEFSERLFGERKVSFLFEKILVERIIKILSGSDNYVYKAYRNITIWKNQKQVAEHDILIVTKWGTVISVDAKTFDVEQKDLDARLLNLRAGAGRYVDFIPVFPLERNDIEQNMLPLKLKRLPFKLKENNIKYFTYNYEKENMEIELKDKSAKLNPVSLFLKELNLLKQHNSNNIRV